MKSKKDRRYGGMGVSPNYKKKEFNFVGKKKSKE